MTYTFSKCGIFGLKINNKQAISSYFFTQKQTFQSKFTPPVFIAMQEATNFLEIHTSADWSKIVLMMANFD